MTDNTYKVIKQHYGDKQYYQGDERVVNRKQDAEYLINQGLIAESDDKKQTKQATTPKTKAKAPPKNKADDAIIENKAE